MKEPDITFGVVPVAGWQLTEAEAEALEIEHRPLGIVNDDVLSSFIETQYLGLPVLVVPAWR